MSRFPCVRQTDESDCGAAALASIAMFHRVHVGRERMRDLVGTDRAGASLHGMRCGAEKLGFRARSVKAPNGALDKVPLPAIAHIRNAEGLGHFVVIYRVTKKYLVIADPAKETLKQPRADFVASWTGYLLLVEPGRERVNTGVATSPARRFLALLLAYRPALLEAVFCALLMTALGILGALFLQHLVDYVIARSDAPLLNALGVGMLVVVVFRVLFGALRQYLLVYIGRQAGMALVADYTNHVLGLPMRFFETRRVGEILSRVNDATKVRDAISGVTLTIVVDGMMVLVSLVVLWLYDWRLAACATAFVPVLVIAVMAHHPAARRRAREAMEAGALLQAKVVEDISGIETIKALGVEDARIDAGESRIVAFAKSMFSTQLLGVSCASLAAAITGFAGIVVLWYGGHRVMAGALSLGQLMFFNSLLGYLLQPLERLAQVNLQIQDALVAVDRLHQVLDLDVERIDDASKARLTAIDDAIELRGVGFRYGSRKAVLDRVDMRIPAGSTVAIIGESGSGKTTLLKLLMRFYDATDGQVLIDGVDIRDYSRNSVRQLVGLVSQEPFIFNGTIRENIAMANPSATLDQIIDAARAAGLEETIAQMPDRYETMIGERGANLSGGQRQRLAIARALVGSPQLLIFDEATSHLDTATERAIQQSLETVLRGRTAVLVAHRLSTVRNADLIYVLRGGEIVEAGSHSQLISLGGHYAALWRAQGGDEERSDLVTEPHLMLVKGLRHA